MTEIATDELLAEMPIEPGAHLDPKRLEHYVSQDLDVIEPVVVFRTEEGLLLADGYHRLAAARRRSATSISADIRAGSRSDALRYAAGVAAAQRGISTEEAMDHIRRLSRSGSRGFSVSRAARRSVERDLAAERLPLTAQLSGHARAIRKW